MISPTDALTSTLRSLTARALSPVALTRMEARELALELAKACVVLHAERRLALRIKEVRS